MAYLRTVLCACAASLVATASSAGTVTGVTAKPSSVKTGSALNVTVTGTNPCGAAFIDYGDGTAITYAITGLPVTKAHTYNRPGRYTVIAKGMGNCDGEVSTAVEVTGPPAAPPPKPAPAPQITAVTITPPAGRVREPNTIRIDGTGPCDYTVDFGDGNTEDGTGLPRTIRHTYGAANTYVIVVRPTPPCSGKFTQKVTIADTKPVEPPRLTGLKVNPAFVSPGQAVTFEVTGTGPCEYRLDFGDGNTYDRNQPLPDHVRHTYTAEDSYSVLAVGKGQCSGSARAIVNVFVY